MRDVVVVTVVGNTLKMETVPISWRVKHRGV